MVTLLAFKRMKQISCQQLGDKRFKWRTVKRKGSGSQSRGGLRSASSRQKLFYVRCLAPKNGEARASRSNLNLVLYATLIYAKLRSGSSQLRIDGKCSLVNKRARSFQFLLTKHSICSLISRNILKGLIKRDCEAGLWS